MRTYDGKNSKNLDMLGSFLLEDGGLVIFETQMSIELY
jgi:hypothetical protein